MIATHQAPGNIQLVPYIGFEGRFGHNSLYWEVEFLDFGEKQCLIKIFHALRASADHVYPLRRAFASGITDHPRQCRLPALRGQLTTMDELLRTSGVENEFVRRSLNHWIKTLGLPTHQAVSSSSF